MAEVAVVVPTTKEDLHIEFPDIKLDASRCHGRCRISQDGRCLENRTRTDYPSPSNPFKFLGTCGTEFLPEQTCYWQVLVEGVPDRCFVAGKPLCEVGVATMETLEACGQGSCVSQTQHPATAVVLQIHQKDDDPRQISNVRVTADVYQSNKAVQSCKALSDYCHLESFRRALGFLLNVPKKTLAILDVTKEKIMWKVEVDVSKPLWPFFSLVYEGVYIKGDVTLQVEKSEDLTLTPKMFKLIRSVSKEGD